MKRKLTRALVDSVRAMRAEAVAAAGTFDDDPQGYHARYRHQMDLLGKALKDHASAHVRDRWDGAAVSIAGIRSSSTSSLGGAVRNWLILAEKRLEQETSR